MNLFELATKYNFNFDSNPDKNQRISTLVLHLEKYVNGAMLEMDRLETVRKAVRKDRKKSIYRISCLALDTHFFFICIDKCYKLISKLAKELDNREIQKLKTRINQIFDIQTIRDHLEHIDDRTMGYLSKRDKNKQKQTSINDFGKFIGDDFSFNNKTFPSNKQSLMELKYIYKELVAIVNNKYTAKDPDFIKKVLRDRQT